MPIPPAAPRWTEQLADLLDSAQASDRAGAALTQEEAWQRAEQLILAVKAGRRKVMVLGNGGSAAIASHVQTDLAHSLGVRALVLSEPALLTAQSNDHGYALAFANLAGLWTDPGDLLVAISSSGQSANILEACARARGLGAGLLTLSGFQPGNPLRRLGDLNFHVASDAYGPVETAHGALLHHLTDRLLAKEASR